MKLLENIGFSEEEIRELEASIPSLMKDELAKEEKLVINNISI